ncbi:MAG: SAM-dependent methyltransferase [Planctomycetes bacterium HGW-Planctomycetes-1]|nr:MAG: SAM-dependent methyltransferase [Planctomycetes bacterium HGW-Planctomycetes-1]
MKKCRICKSPIEPFISFGQMPIANGFLTREQFADEYFFELQAAFCANCTMVQLIDQPEPQKMFHENYAFFSSTSKRMAVHFEEFANHVKKDYLTSSNPFVVELGCNDGIMLQHFANSGIKHLGIEPSVNVARVANEKGVQTISEFFNESTAKDILGKYGQTDAFLAANVMCHIADFNSVIAGIKMLVNPDGIVMFEDPYLGDVIEKTSYDQLYDEHVFLFSLSSIKYAFEQYDMELVDIEPQGTHGGSMRYIIAHKGARLVSKNVYTQLEKEKEMKLNKVETYNVFRKNCEKSRDSLKQLLVDINKRGKRVVGYAATSKSTTILNYCGIGPDLIEFISDTTPIKQGKFSPGMHIPVRAYEEFMAKYPDYAVLLAWNHGEEIMDKEKQFKAAGGKWIIFVPEVKVV